MIEDKVCVLYVDDEVNNLTSFKACFRKFYTIFTTTSTEEALAILNKNKIHCVIADQRMPGMTGVEFLESVVKAHPETVRMLLTGYSDVESVIDAINKGQIYKYIVKPWDEQYLKMTIDNAYDIYITKYLLDEKTKNLEKAQQELNRFAYSASHDLREPLSSILGIVNLAKLEERYKDDKYIRMIETMVKKLDRFTKNIIDHYKSSNSEQQIKSIDFKVIIDDIIENIKLFRDTTVVDFIVNVNQQEAFNADEFRIGLIFNNLISNAINHRSNDKGKTVIEVTVSVKNSIASILVKDNGNGIEPEYVEHIFEMFYRASSKATGSGLGLYIVNEAVDKVKGRIYVCSSLEYGTTFKIIIPSQKLD